jgi:hypothetical protein
MWQHRRVVWRRNQAIARPERTLRNECADVPGQLLELQLPIARSEDDLATTSLLKNLPGVRPATEQDCGDLWDTQPKGVTSLGPGQPHKTVDDCFPVADPRPQSSTSEFERQGGQRNERTGDAARELGKAPVDPAGVRLGERGVEQRSRVNDGRVDRYGVLLIGVRLVKREEVHVGR